MIFRRTDVELVGGALKRSRVAALLGPRQCGKTTLARQFVPAESLNYFDLEDPQGLAPFTARAETDSFAKRVEVLPLAELVNAT